MPGQQPDKGEGGGGTYDDEAPPSRAERSERFDREEDHTFLDDIGLRRLRLMVSRYGDDEVEKHIFSALREAYANPEVNTVEELLSEASAVLVSDRDLFPGDHSFRDAEYWVGAVQSVISRDYINSAAWLGSPMYDVGKAYLWALKDIAPLIATPIGQSVLGFPEYLIRENKENPTTRPGLGSIRAALGVMDAVWIDRDVSWDTPSANTKTATFGRKHHEGK